MESIVIQLRKDKDLGGSYIIYIGDGVAQKKSIEFLRK
jgi:hypothetical protein